MKKVTLVPFLFAGLLAGCSDLNQDPMAEKPGVLNNISGKPTLPPVTTPVASDAVRIDTVDFISFEEGRTGEFQIGARVLLPDYTYEVTVENLPDFSGASYDTSNGKFIWTPKGVLIGDEVRAERILQIRVLARKNNGPVLIARKNVTVQVNRVFNEPKITLIETPTDGIREGEFASMTVKVTDLDAGSDSSTWPTLLMKNFDNQLGLAGFMEVEKVLQLAPGEFDYKVRIDLRGVEVVQKSEFVRTSLMAVSRFARRSAAQDVNIRVKNLLNRPQTTWTDRIDFDVNETVNSSFLIIDPKGEGEIKSITFNKLPSGSRATCQQKERWMHACRFEWDTDSKTPAQNYDFEAVVVYRGTDYFSDPQEIRETFTLRLNLRPQFTNSPQGVH